MLIIALTEIGELERVKSRASQVGCANAPATHRRTSPMVDLIAADFAPHKLNTGEQLEAR